MTTTWSIHKKKKAYPPLEKNIKTDVAIIGGGMAGLLAAYRLSSLGKSVVLLDKGEIGSGATAATTAFITKVIDSELSQIAEIFSPQIAKSVWDSGQEAIEEFERIVKKEKIECEFGRVPNYVFASAKKQFKDLEEEYGFYRRFKIKANLEPGGESLGFKNFGFLEVPNQAKFHPTKFLYTLAEKARGYGARIFEKTEVTDIEGVGPVIIKSKKGNVAAQDVIIATYKPTIGKRTHLKKAMYRSYIFEVQVPKNLFKEALYEDMSNPYYYFRIDSQHEDYDRMIIGGEDHKDIFGNTLVKASFQSLREFLESLVGDAPYWLRNKWYGPILEPSDGLPLIGRILPHYYVATGFSGNGMTYSMISSLLISDLILEKKNIWQKAYEPKRTLLHPKRLGLKAKDYIEEFFGGAVKNLLS